MNVFELLSETGFGSSLLLAALMVGLPAALWVERKRAGR